MSMPLFEPGVFSAELALAAVLSALGGALTDLRSRRLPNVLTGPAMLVGLTLHLARGGWRECLAALAALVLAGSVLLLFHLAGGMGAGDVKFVAAQACLLGFSGLVPLLVYTALAGGVMALAMAVAHGRLRQTLGNVGALIAYHRHAGLEPHPQLHVHNPEALRLPYGVAIAAGSLLTLVLTWLPGAAR